MREKKELHTPERAQMTTLTLVYGSEQVLGTTQGATILVISHERLYLKEIPDTHRQRVAFSCFCLRLFFKDIAVTWK